MHPTTTTVMNSRQMGSYGGVQSAWGDQAWSGSRPAGTSYGAAYGLASDYVDAFDGTWSFRVFNDGLIEIIDGPGGIGTSYKPGDSNYNTVLANLKGYSFDQKQAIEQVLGGGAVSVGESNQGVSQVMSWLAHQVGTAGTPEEKAQAQANVAQAANVYGPGFVNGVRQLLSSNGKSLAALQRQLARKKAKYYSTTNVSKKLKLKFEIVALEQQIAAYGVGTSAAQAQLSFVPTSGGSGFPWWLLAVAVGGLVLLGGVGALSRRK